MKIYTIVLNWNQPKLTIETVESLQKIRANKIDFKIVIVDNGSTDTSIEEFRKIKPSKFPLEIMPTNQNLGFAGGNNVGIKYALDKDADYVLVINNDVEVDRDLLINLVNTTKQNAKMGIVSPKIYFAKGYEFHKEKYKKNELGKIIWYAGGKIDWKNIYGKNIGVDEYDRKQFDKEKEIDFATGACFLANVKALKEVGLFNEKYFMYMEDMELSVRMKQKNWKIIYNPKAILWHKVSQSSDIGSSLNDYFISRNRLMFGFKYANFRTKFALFRESLRLFIFGRHFQAVGIRDFYFRKFGKGSWPA